MDRFFIVPRIPANEAFDKAHWATIRNHVADLRLEAVFREKADQTNDVESVEVVFTRFHYDHHGTGQGRVAISGIARFSDPEIGGGRFHGFLDDNDRHIEFTLSSMS